MPEWGWEHEHILKQVEKLDEDLSDLNVYAEESLDDPELVIKMRVLMQATSIVIEHLRAKKEQMA